MKDRLTAWGRFSAALICWTACVVVYAEGIKSDVRDVGTQLRGVDKRLERVENQLTGIRP